eukprot:10929363-Karenia_brevis.AAC.1
MHIPDWKDFLISDCAEYLGIWLGPGADKMHWVSQLTKLIERVGIIANACVAPYLAVKTYNIKGATVLSYPSQFLPLPPDISKIERY